MIDYGLQTIFVYCFTQDYVMAQERPFLLSSFPTFLNTDWLLLFLKFATIRDSPYHVHVGAEIGVEGYIRHINKIGDIYSSW